MRQHREEVEAAERAERERREAPIREATQKLQDTHRKLREIERERIDKLKDDDIYVSPHLKGARMSESAAASHNERTARQFLKDNGDWYYNSHANNVYLVDYFIRNDVSIIDEAMYDKAARKLMDLDLFPDKRPEPESATVPAPAPEPESRPTEPELIDGWCLNTGEKKKWRPFDLDRLSSRDYRRALRLYGENQPRVTNLGPGPNGRRPNQ